MANIIASAADMPPIGSKLPVLRQAAHSCRACPLWKNATQTVFGEGPVHAPLLLIGEQPGDEEDRAGHPFVGPSGRLLVRALDQAGIDRAAAFVTNAVKHFKWTASPERGKRRLHKRPSTTEVRACRPWLLGEIAAVAPRVIVCLGATAAQALLGPAFRVTADRGRALAFEGPPAATILATVHPAAILRAPDEETRHQELQRFVADLRVAARLAGAGSDAARPDAPPGP